MPLTIEQELAALSTSVAAVVAVVGTQQAGVNAAVAAFTATIARVAALNKVLNTTDAEKPISTAAQEALDTLQAKLVSGFNMKTVNGLSLLGPGDIAIQRSATSRSAVAYEDRGTLRALSPQVDDCIGVEGIGLFQWTNTQLEPEDDETCFNTPAVSTLVLDVLTVTTPAGQWLLREPAVDLLDAWALDDQEITDNWREDEPKRFAAYLLANK